MTEKGEGRFTLGWVRGAIGRITGGWIFDGQPPTVVPRPNSSVMTVSRPWQNTLSVVPSDYVRTVTGSRQYAASMSATEG